MIPDTWAKVHGAATHFPVALSLFATACDLAAWLGWDRTPARTFRDVGMYAMAAAAISAVPAVITGLLLTRGEAWGEGALRWHHRFVWPAFALIIAAAVWRTRMRRDLTRSALAAYLLAAATVSGLISAAGYWGGELLQRFT
jgi:uncharacterized membrane protein